MHQDKDKDMDEAMKDDKDEAIEEVSEELEEIEVNIFFLRLSFKKSILSDDILII